MNYRIEQRESFQMFGVYGLINLDMKTAFIEVPQFRKKCDDDGSVDLMNEILGRFGDTVLHAALYDHTGESFKYMICYHLPKTIEIPERFTKLFVPASTWAIFPEPQCDLQNYGNECIPSGFQHPNTNRLKDLASRCIMGCQ